MGSYWNYSGTYWYILVLVLWMMDFSSIETYKGRGSCRFNQYALSCVLLHGLQDVWKSAHSQGKVINMFQGGVGVEKRFTVVRLPLMLLVLKLQVVACLHGRHSGFSLTIRGFKDHELASSWSHVSLLLKPKARGNCAWSPSLKTCVHSIAYIICIHQFISKSSCVPIWHVKTAPGHQLPLQQMQNAWFSGAGFSGPPRTIPHVCLDLWSRLGDAIAPSHFDIFFCALFGWTECFSWSAIIVFHFVPRLFTRIN